MNADLIQWLNLALTGGIAAYLIKTEHRFTKLETYMKILLQQWNLIKDDDER